MWLILVGVVIFVIAISLIPQKKPQEVIARPKEREPVRIDICDELNELEAQIFRYPNGMSVNSPYNQRIFGRQEQIINNYYQAGVDIDMDIATQRWKVK